MAELTVYQDKTLSTYDEVERAAKAMAASGFFQDARMASQAIVKILAGRELGFGAFASMSGINIIEGKPTLSANIMASAVKRSGRYNYRVTEMTDTICTIAFSELIGGTWQNVGVSSFTLAEAKKALLTEGSPTKNGGKRGYGNWEKYPKNMLFARAISSGIRYYCPDVMNGSAVYTPEELGADTDIDGEVVEWKVEPVKVEATIVQETSQNNSENLQENVEKVSEIPQNNLIFSLENAMKIVGDDGKTYGELDSKSLAGRATSLNSTLRKNELNADEKARKELHLKAAKMIMQARSKGEIN
jgi:hypothetical protein